MANLTSMQRALVLGAPDAMTETTLVTKAGTCDVTWADLAPITVGAVCSCGKTAVSGSVKQALTLLRRKHTPRRTK